MVDLEDVRLDAKEQNLTGGNFTVIEDISIHKLDVIVLARSLVSALKVC